MQEIWVPPLGQEDPPEKEVAPTTVFLPQKSQGQKEPGSLQSTGSQRVGNEWSDFAQKHQIEKRSVSLIIQYDPKIYSTSH